MFHLLYLAAWEAPQYWAFDTLEELLEKLRTLSGGTRYIFRGERLKWTKDPPHRLLVDGQYWPLTEEQPPQLTDDPTMESCDMQDVEYRRLTPPQT